MACGKGWAQTSSPVPRKPYWPFRPPFTPDRWQLAGQGTIRKTAPCVCTRVRTHTDVHQQTKLELAGDEAELCGR